MAAAIQTDIIEAEKAHAATITDATIITGGTQIAETITEEIIATAITTIIASKTPTPETAMEAMGNTAAIMISAPTTKNAPSKWAGLNSIFAPGTKNAPTC